MLQVDEAKSIFTLDIYFRQYWTDKRLVFNSSQVGDTRTLTGRCWDRPGLGGRVGAELAVPGLDLETRHLLCQRGGVLPAQGGRAQQVHQVPPCPVQGVQVTLP